MLLRFGLIEPFISRILTYLLTTTLEFLLEQQKTVKTMECLMHGT